MDLKDLHKNFKFKVGDWIFYPAKEQKVKILE